MGTWQTLCHARCPGYLTEWSVKCLKRIISMLIAVTIALAGSVMPVFATGETDIENLTFSDGEKLLCWDGVGTDYIGANIYKYNKNGSLQKLGYTEDDKYTYPEMLCEYFNVRDLSIGS